MQPPAPPTSGVFALFQQAILRYAPGFRLLAMRNFTSRLSEWKQRFTERRARGTIALARITDTGGLVALTKRVLARYPGDKDGLARYCINVQVTLPQEMVLYFQMLAVIGLRPEWVQFGEDVGESGPIYSIARGSDDMVRTVSIAHVAAGLQAIFDKKRKVNQNLRMRFFGAIYGGEGARFIDGAACAALVKLGWGESV